MKKYFFFVFLMLYACDSFAMEKINIICTTTHLSSIVTAITHENSRVSTIIPYGMCPGHFDISPKEITELKNANIIFYHGYERFVEDLRSTDDNRFTKIDIAGNLMIPEYHIKAANFIARILSERFPVLKDTIHKNLEEYHQKIENQETALRNELTGFKNTSVLCAEMNAEFITWLGAEVVATFPRDEDMSLNAMRKITGKATAAQIKLVVDNLQSSGKVGKTFAIELGVPLVMLSNFPEKNSYLDTLQNMCTKIIQALRQDQNE